MFKQRFSDEFYRDMWKNCGYDFNNIPIIARIVNDKVKELCNLVSPQGALKILQIDGKLQ